MVRRMLTSENKRKWKGRQILGPCQRTKKPMGYGWVCDTIWNLCAWNGFEILGKETGRFGNQRKNGYYSDSSIIKIG